MHLSAIITAASLALASPAVELAQSAPAVQCATSGATSVSELHREWILAGWDKPVVDQPWIFARSSASTMIGRAGTSCSMTIWPLISVSLARQMSIARCGSHRSGPCAAPTIWSSTVLRRLSVMTWRPRRWNLRGGWSRPRASRSSRFARARRWCGDARATVGRSCASTTIHAGSRQRSPTRSSASDSACPTHAIC